MQRRFSFFVRLWQSALTQAAISSAQAWTQAAPWAILGAWTNTATRPATNAAVAILLIIA